LGDKEVDPLASSQDNGRMLPSKRAISDKVCLRPAVKILQYRELCVKFRAVKVIDILALLYLGSRRVVKSLIDDMTLAEGHILIYEKDWAVEVFKSASSYRRVVFPKRVYFGSKLFHTSS